VIRPLAYAPESEIARFAELMKFPIIPCDLCGSQENLQRQRVKRLVDELAKDIPMLRSSLLSAMGNLHVSHLLDQKLWSVPTEAPPTASRQAAPALVTLHTENEDAA
jgi:tRNA 2-thiocytidine biosynthesis protein TtcA